MKSLTRPEEQILLAVHRLADQAYSVEIKRFLEKLTNKNWSMGAIYDPLDRLDKNGLLTSYISEPLQERGGRSKRIYQLTKRGIESLIQIKKVTDSIWDGISVVSLEKKFEL